MKTLTVQLPDDVYVRAEQRAIAQGAALAGEVAQFITRYGEGASVQESAKMNSLSANGPQFGELVHQWKEATKHVSSTTDIAMHPAYQQIIGMGSKALPFILAEMRRQPGQWFWALKAITGEDPVVPADRGKVQRMTQAWLTWAEQRGL